MDLSRRALHIPVDVKIRNMARVVLRVGAALQACKLEAAEAEVEALLTQIRAIEGPLESDLVLTGDHLEDAQEEAWHEHDVETAAAPGGPGGDEPDAPVQVEEVVNYPRRAALLCKMLVDLYEAGWQIDLDEGELYAIAPRYDADGARTLTAAKDALRDLLTPRVETKLRDAAEFIRGMEAPRDQTEDGAIALIADGARLASSLRARGAAAIQPYVERARPEDGLDEHTGLERWQIFRYLRYHWSFPYESTPGRSLPFLIRDAGQPGHPVCGLLCLSSPVLRLTARDCALGWTPQWLEAVVAGFDVADDAIGDLTALRGHFASLRDDLKARRDAKLTTLVPARILTDLCAYLSLPRSAEPSSIARDASRLPPGELRARLEGARLRLAAALLDEVSDAIQRIDLSDLGITRAGALERPLTTAEHLEEVGARARRAWAASRSDEAAAEQPGDAPDWLFMKKRALQLARYLRGWADFEELRGATERGPDALVAALRDATSDRTRPWTHEPNTICDGKRVSRGLRVALLQRLTRLMASQAADVSVCGAIPPYNALLGGKLAALLALSREVSRAWHDAYADLPSEIQSKMEGREVRRPSTLIALTTSSFYPVGSAQYNRLRYGDELSWARVGASSGHGTLHFSDETSRLAQGLLRAETGLKLNTSTFGEGPSEKMRKLRDAMSRLGLPSDELLRHGMSRLVYVAELDPATRPGLPSALGPHHASGPTCAELAEHWRARWLSGRLEGGERLARLARFRREEGLVSFKREHLFEPEGAVGCGGNE